MKDAVKKLLDEYGVYYFSPAANGYGRAGIPDIVCCVHGWFLAIECKAGSNTTTALQDRELEKIHRAGGVYMVVRANCEAMLRVTLDELISDAAN